VIEKGEVISTTALSSESIGPGQRAKWQGNLSLATAAEMSLSATDPSLSVSARMSGHSKLNAAGRRFTLN